MKSPSNRATAALFCAVALALAACSDPSGGDAADALDEALDEGGFGFGLEARSTAPSVAFTDWVSEVGEEVADDLDGGDLDDLDAPATDASADREPTDLTDATDAVDSADGTLCPPRDPIPADEPYLRAGTGATEYEAVENCAEVPILVGFQGSGHLWGAFELGGLMVEEEALFNLDFAFEQQGELVAEAHFVDVLRRSGEPAAGPYHYSGVTVVVGFEFTLESRLDVPGVLTVRVRDGEELDLSDEVVLVPNELVE